MDELHRRLIRIGLDALADDFGYALAGGYAVQAHQSKVKLVAEFLNHPPVPSALGPVLHPDDVAAGKTTALGGRAEVRDAIDVDGLLKAGYTRERLMELARQNDDGFEPRMFADSLARIQRYTDRQCAAYGLTTTEATSLRERFADWQHQLTTPKDDNPAQKRATAAATASPSLQQPPVPQDPNTPPTGPSSPERPQPGSQELTPALPHTPRPVPPVPGHDAPTDRARLRRRSRKSCGPERAVSRGTARSTRPIRSPR